MNAFCYSFFTKKCEQKPRYSPDADKNVVPGDFPQLSPAMQEEVWNWVYGGAFDKTISSNVDRCRFTITQDDIKCLQWGKIAVGKGRDAYLNDNVINFYLDLLRRRSETDKNLPRVYTLDSVIVPILVEFGYSSVGKWTLKEIDIFEYEIILVPAFKTTSNHWCIAIIHIKNRTIKYHDSMGAPNRRVVERLVEFLQKRKQLERQEIRPERMECARITCVLNSATEQQLRLRYVQLYVCEICSTKAADRFYARKHAIL